MIAEAARAIGRRLLKLPAQPLLRLGHRRDRRELFQQCVPAEGALNRQRRVPRLYAAVLPLQHLDLLVEQILRQLVSIVTRSQFLRLSTVEAGSAVLFSHEPLPISYLFICVRGYETGANV